MLCEVFESFDWPIAVAGEDGQRGVAHGGEHLRRMADVGSRLILAARDIAGLVSVFSMLQWDRES